MNRRAPVSQRQLTLERRTSRLLILGCALPLAVALGLLTWRAGQAGRNAAAAELVRLADRLSADARAIVLGPLAATRPVRDALSALNGERTAAYYSAAANWRSTGGAIASIDVLDEATRNRLESLDRTFVANMAGRITAIAPVKDSDQWDLLGAVVVQRTVADPARLPLAPLAIAILASLLAAVLARRTAVRLGDLHASQLLPGDGSPARPASSRLDSAGSATRRLNGAFIAFAFLAGLACFVMGRYDSATSGLWALAAFVAWLVPAGIAWSLAHTVSNPLRFREAAHSWAFLAPSLAHLVLFSLGPILFSLWLSFHEWDLLSPDRPFVGIDNYRALAADPDFMRSLGNTAIYVLFVPVGMAVALALALLLNRRIPGVRALRAVFFLPYITSFVAISLVWRWMFQPDIGLLNGILAQIGIPPQPWLSSPATALPSLMLMSIWMYAGYMMIIFLAGLQSIPESLYESARIDGAGAWQRFRYITLPMLRPTTLFLLVTMVIFMFQVFTAVYVMTEGGPLHATDVIVYHIYRNAWEYLRMGYASAMAWVLFAIVFVITLVQFRFLGARPAQ